MNGVLEPFSYPVSCEGDEDQKTDDLGSRARSASAGAGRTGRIATTSRARLVFDVYCHQSDRKPGSEGDRYDSANRADEKNVAKVCSNVHGLLQHHDTKRDPRDPAHEADNAEDRKHKEDNGRGVIMTREVVRSGRQAQHDVQDSRDPDELLCESSRCKEVCPRSDERHRQNEDKEDNGICVQGEVVGIVVDSIAGEGLVAGVTLQ